jgi:cytochrome b subunit of formate dehydrogenase
LGPVYAFSGGLAVRADRIAVCDFGAGVTALPEKFVAGEGAAGVEFARGRDLGSLAIQEAWAEEAYSYGVLQRISYLVVVFVLFPVMIWTGMAMSPAVTSVFPFFVRTSGGYESARTIHFFAANLLVLFVLVHVAMVIVAGFVQRTRAMITGRVSGGRERP